MVGFLFYVVKRLKENDICLKLVGKLVLWLFYKVCSKWSFVVERMKIKFINLLLMCVKKIIK